MALRPNAGHGLLILEVFLDHTQQRATVGRTPLDEWSARHRDFYLTTHNTHNRQTSMPPVGFEPTISAGKQPQTYALDCAATGTGSYCKCIYWIPFRHWKLHSSGLLHEYSHYSLHNNAEYRSFQLLCSGSLKSPLKTFFNVSGNVGREG